MHLIEAFALTAGKKIDRMFIRDKFFPLPFEKYIIFQPFSKESKNYDYWMDVISIVKPILDKHKITIVQIGAAGEKPVEGCYHIQGQTSVAQVAYLIKNSCLTFGADSFGLHLAGHYNKPLVGLYSNNYAENVRPYFGDKERQVILEPERTEDEKPCLSFVENPKSINRIKPEKIAEAICDLLSLQYDFPFETVYIGPVYHLPRMIEMEPNVAINPSSLGLNTLIVRMDFYFNEQVLANQLSVCDCCIVTNRPLNEQLLLLYKNRIKQIVYIIDEHNSRGFAQFLKYHGFNFHLISFLPNDVLNKFKLDYLDIKPIELKRVAQTIEDTQFKGISKEKLFYRTNKFTLSNKKIFPSRAASIRDIALNGFTFAFHPVIDDPAFYQELEYCHIVKLKN